MPNYLKLIAENVLHVFGVRTSEEPPYSVIAKFGEVEIRGYGPRLAAETSVDMPDERRAINAAFDRLAGYIFGGNRAQRDINMTAPVSITNDMAPPKPGADASREIAMTAPVEIVSGQTGQLTMRFFLPAEITASTAPEPNDPMVRLVPIPAETMAVLAYSGSGNPEMVKQRKAELMQHLAKSNWQATSEPVSLFYDPPWTLPFLRRNEVAVRVSEPVRT